MERFQAIHLDALRLARALGATVDFLLLRLFELHPAAVVGEVHERLEIPIEVQRTRERLQGLGQ